ncbi:hypothetical protein LWI29_021998 [Acer saccharum]|uniref:Uncharacterized protein n=1 Tax=Acer saccharum TaxID=4024 RepID=A0AA39T8Q5_ACESA|nr:hypothetical protein LWI29_021998 [Acer saccharum]
MICFSGLHSEEMELCVRDFRGFIATYATLASRDVDCCLIPESPFYLEGLGGHMAIVIAEDVGSWISQKIKGTLICIHGEIAGYTGFTFGHVNGTRAYITFHGYF